MHLENQPQSELYLSWSISVCGLEKIRRFLVGSWEVVVINTLIKLNELASGVNEGIVRDVDAFVVAVEHIKEFRQKSQFEIGANIEMSGKSHVRGRIVRT